MGRPSTSPSPDAVLSSSPVQWDGKCQNCRKLMSRCMCFRESEGDVNPLQTSSIQVIADASETRPLWNALRKMHRKSATSRLALMQPPSSSRPSTSSHRKHSEVLPPLRAPTPSSKHRRSDARPLQRSRRPSREPRREPSPERHSISRKDRLQRAGFASSSHDLKRNAKDSGVMRSVQSANSIDKHRAIKEKFRYEPVGSGPSDVENVWEL